MIDVHGTHDNMAFALDIHHAHITHLERMVDHYKNKTRDILIKIKELESYQVVEHVISYCMT